MVVYKSASKEAKTPKGALKMTKGSSLGRAMEVHSQFGLADAPQSVIVALADDTSHKKILNDIILWSDSDEHGVYRHSEKFVADTVLMVAAFDPDSLIEWTEEVTEPILYPKEYWSVYNPMHFQYFSGVMNGLFLVALWLEKSETRSYFLDSEGIRLDDEKRTRAQKAVAAKIVELLPLLPGHAGSTEEVGKSARKYAGEKGTGPDYLLEILPPFLRRNSTGLSGLALSIVTNLFYGAIARKFKLAGNDSAKIADILTTVMKVE